MILKKHHSQGKHIVALCDDDLLGKQIEEEDVVLDLQSQFYQGEQASEEDILASINEAYIVNAVGKKTIEFLIKNNFVEKESCKKVKDIPYVQVVFERE